MDLQWFPPSCVGFFIVYYLFCRLKLTSTVHLLVAHCTLLNIDGEKNGLWPVCPVYCITRILCRGMLKQTHRHLRRDSNPQDLCTDHFYHAHVLYYIRRKWHIKISWKLVNLHLLWRTFSIIIIIHNQTWSTLLCVLSCEKGVPLYYYTLHCFIIAPPLGFCPQCNDEGLYFLGSRWMELLSEYWRFKNITSRVDCTHELYKCHILLSKSQHRLLTS